MDIRVAPDPAGQAAAIIARRLRDAVRRRGNASLALSGGSTAPPMIEALLADDVPWESVTVWQVDERVVADGDPARNAAQLDAVPAAIRLMPVTVVDRRAGARRYSAGLPDRFDVVHLGLGTDGHTASWPPDQPAIAESERSVELVEAFNGHDRMTLTRRPINGARCRVVLTTGASKAEMVQRWLLGDPSLPITRVKRTDTFLVVDPSAAPSSAVLDGPR